MRNERTKPGRRCGVPCRGRRTPDASMAYRLGRGVVRCRGARLGHLLHPIERRARPGWLDHDHFWRIAKFRRAAWSRRAYVLWARSLHAMEKLRVGIVG